MGQKTLIAARSIMVPGIGVFSKGQPYPNVDQSEAVKMVKTGQWTFATDESLEFWKNRPAHVLEAARKSVTIPKAKVMADATVPGTELIAANEELAAERARAERLQTFVDTVTELHPKIAEKVTKVVDSDAHETTKALAEKADAEKADAAKADAAKAETAKAEAEKAEAAKADAAKAETAKAAVAKADPAAGGKPAGADLIG